MRVLVSTTAGAGHFGPLVPFAEALRRAGHDVLVAAPGSFASTVERAKFAHYAFADAPPDELQAVFGGLSGLSNDDGNAVVIREIFGRIDTRAALPGVEAAVQEWRPDLILRETCEFASYLVAEAAGVPHVHVAIGLASFGELAFAALEDPLTELGADAGLVSLQSAPTLTLVPESLEGTLPPAVTARRYQDDTAHESAGPLPAWWPNRSDPLVYVTFGTVAGGLGLFPGFYRDVITAFAGVPVHVLLTIGDAGEPEDLGAVPANIHVERWWPQKAVGRAGALKYGYRAAGAATELLLNFSLPGLWRNAGHVNSTKNYASKQTFIKKVDANMGSTWWQSMWQDNPKGVRDQMISESAFTVVDRLDSVYGETHGFAREKHVRKAIKELHKNGKMSTNSKGAIDMKRIKP